MGLFNENTKDYDISLHYFFNADICKQMGYVFSDHNFFFLSALDMDPSTVFKSCKKYQQQSNMLIFIIAIKWGIYQSGLLGAA